MHKTEKNETLQLTELFVVDLEFKIREMGMEIRTEDNFGIIKLMKVFIKGVGPSTLTIDELSWTIRVLDTQVCSSTLHVQYIYEYNR